MIRKYRYFDNSLLCTTINSGARGMLRVIQVNYCSKWYCESSLWNIDINIDIGDTNLYHYVAILEFDFHICQDYERKQVIGAHLYIWHSVNHHDQYQCDTSYYFTWYRTSTEAGMILWASYVSFPTQVLKYKVIISWYRWLHRYWKYCYSVTSNPDIIREKVSKQQSTKQIMEFTGYGDDKNYN